MPDQPINIPYRAVALFGLLLLGGYLLWRQEWFLYLLIVLFAGMLAAPMAIYRALQPFGRLSSVLGRGILYVLLTIVFFLLLTPFAFFYRLFGDTDFRTKNIPGKATFFRNPPKPFSAESFRKEW